MRLPAAVLAIVLSVGVLAGCGADADPPAAASSSAPPVSAAAKDCRSQWRSLGDQVTTASATGVTVRRVFASRWESIGAGAAYYAQSATGTQCGDLLTTQKATVAALSKVTARAMGFDAEQSLASALSARTAKQGTRPGREKKAVAAAYVDLARQTPTATTDLAPAFTELANADPTDPAAVKQGFADLRLLAQTSDAYAACARALRTVKAPPLAGFGAG